MLLQKYLQFGGTNRFQYICSPELCNLLHLLNSNVNLLVLCVVQPGAEPPEDGGGLVLPGADDEGKAELGAVLRVVTLQPPPLLRRQQVEAGLALLPRRLGRQQVGVGQAAREVGMAAEDTHLVMATSIIIITRGVSDNEGNTKDGYNLFRVC